MGKKAKKIISIDIELEDFGPIHLKMDEAKELYEQLHELFGDKQAHWHQHWHRQPYYTWYNFDSVTPTIYGGLVNTTAVSNTTGMKVTYNAAKPFNNESITANGEV